MEWQRQEGREEKGMVRDGDTEKPTGKPERRLEARERKGKRQGRRVIAAILYAKLPNIVHRLFRTHQYQNHDYALVFIYLKQQSEHT